MKKNNNERKEKTELLPNAAPLIPLWLRYVDDVLVAWPEGEDFQSFFHNVNSLSPTINFTRGWEIN